MSSRLETVTSTAERAISRATLGNLSAEAFLNQHGYLFDFYGKRHMAGRLERALELVATLLHGPDATLRPNQRKGILEAFAGRDGIVQLATDSGKTTIFEGVLIIYDLLYNGMLGEERKLPGFSHSRVIVFIFT